MTVHKNEHLLCVTDHPGTKRIAYRSCFWEHQRADVRQGSVELLFLIIYMYDHRKQCVYQYTPFTELFPHRHLSFKASEEAQLNLRHQTHAYNNIENDLIMQICEFRHCLRRISGKKLTLLHSAENPLFLVALRILA
jgi:hypothetical protein